MKNIYKFALLIGVIFSLLVDVTFAQLTTYYSEIGKTDPNNKNNWWTNRNATGSHPNNFNSGIFVIQPQNNMTTTGDWSIQGQISSPQLIIEKSETYTGSLTVSSSHTLTIPPSNTDGILIINSGGIIDCKSFTISGSGTFDLSSGATIKTAHPSGLSSGTGGSITMTGSVNLNENAIYYYYGGTAQVTGSILPGTIYKMEIDNGSGVTLTKNTVVTLLNLKSGHLKLGGKTLTSETKPAGGNEASMIVLDDVESFGTFRIKANRSGNYLFPVGNINSRTNYYTPVDVYLRYGGTNRYLSLQMKGVLLTGNTGNPRLNRYWILTAENFGSYYFDISLQFHQNDVEGNINDLVFGRYTEQEGWVYLYGAEVYPDEINPEYYHFDYSYYNTEGGLGTFTGGDGNSPYPVKLASFNSIINGRDVKLNWVTEMEENNSGFEIQKSEFRSQETGNSIKIDELRIKNTDNWTKIGFVKGNGTKNSATNYFYEDKNLQTGKYKYRLKQIDYNGNYEYFELAGVVEVGVPAKFDLSQNYPNPFNPATKINFDIPQSGLATLKVYDVLGKEVSTIVNEVKDAGYYTVSFDAAGLSSGVYFYRLNVNGFSSVKRLVVLK